VCKSFDGHSGPCDPIEMNFGHRVRFTCQEEINVVFFKLNLEFLFLSC